jgi:predicted PurR-regulated permease PerM
MSSLRRVEQIVVVASLALLVAGCLTVLQPFLFALAWALILSFSTWPLRTWLARRLGGRRTLAATLMTLLVAATFILPLTVAGRGLAESVAKVASMVALLLKEGLPGPAAWVADLPVIGPPLTERWLELERLGAGWTTELQPYIDTGRDWLLGIGLRFGDALLQVSLGVLVAFFFFRDGAEGAQHLSAAVERLAGDRAQRLLAVAGGTVQSVVYGVIGTALAQAVLQTVGLWLADVPAPFFLGFLTFFLAFVPIGPPLIWLPAAAWLLYEDAFAWGLFVAIWGFFVVSGIDNVLRPYLISRGAPLPWILVFLGVVGGVMAFGFLGVFLGPTLLAVGYALMQEWSAGPSAAEDQSLRKVAPGPATAGASAPPPAVPRVEPEAQGLPSAERDIVHSDGSMSPARTREVA